VVRLIIAERLAKAAVLFALGVSLLVAGRTGHVQGWVAAARDELNLSAGHGLISQLVERALDFLGRFPHLTAFAAAALLYAGLEATEGVGLAMRRRWADYLTVLATGVFIPFELWEVAHRVTLLRTGALAVNLAIVIYLAYRKRLFVGL
jgi:uncharacterized membrane protein (DUF2068 family)